MEDYANEGSVTRIFREIWELARDILSSEEAANECMEVIPRADWVQACSRRILCATRRIEELLGPGRALCFRVQTLKQHFLLTISGG